MISIIICSVSESSLAGISENIERTIGVTFEIISFNNIDNRTGICELYNRGIQQAQYNILCFVHEDIIVHTNHWGKTVLNIFSDNINLGLLSVAGSYYKPISPSGWMGFGADTECINIVQAYKFTDKAAHLNYKNPGNSSLAEVACIDGLWFCTPKHIASAHKFDEQTFKGFHCYDIDFSISVGLHYKVMVTYDILLTHLSEGCYNKIWLLEVIKLHKKWNKSLPIKKGKLLLKNSLHLEKVTFKHFLYQLTEFDLPLSLAFKILWQNSFFKKVGLKLFLKLNFYSCRRI